MFSVAVAVAVAVPQQTELAAPQTGPGRRWQGWLGRRCCRCCRHCGVLFINEVFHICLLNTLLLYYIYIIFFVYDIWFNCPLVDSQLKPKSRHHGKHLKVTPRQWNGKAAFTCVHAITGRSLSLALLLTSQGARQSVEA